MDLGRTLRVFLFSSYPLGFKTSRLDEPNDWKRREKEGRREGDIGKEIQVSGTSALWLKMQVAPPQVVRFGNRGLAPCGSVCR